MNESPSPTQSKLVLRCAVVGVDGSAESSAALEWAARAVGPEGTVVAVNAADGATDLSAVTRRLEGEWTSPLHATGCQIDFRVRVGRPADVLIDVAGELRADMIVVGAHAKPRHLPRTIGRVTAELLRDADRPLVVVDGGESSFEPGGTIVVDVAGGTATAAAVAWAASFADARGAALQLVHSRPTRPYLGPDGLLEVMAFYIDPDVLALWAAEDLDELVDEIQRGTDHDLRIKWSSEMGRRGPHVVEAAKSATLIILGRNSLPGASRMVPHDLRQVITNAPCPVVVVPPEDEESPRAR